MSASPPAPLPAPAHCHAMRVRPASSQEPTGRQGLWIEDVPVPSTDPLAERRRATELARPARGPRRVLLRYADGLSDPVSWPRDAAP
ncbi:hypothetical protein, partial [Streptomyces resistomycificus]|uniref:hypothetical protein n=1 Tax=Streptomyces resistomycificus TaxID=67356 RepID=UPI0004AA2458